MDLQELLNALAVEGADVQAILAELSAEDLAALETELLAEFDRLRTDAEINDEQLQLLEQLAGTHELLTGETARRDAAAAERAARVAELTARVRRDDGDDDTGDDPDNGDSDDGDNGGGDADPAAPAETETVGAGQASTQPAEPTGDPAPAPAAAGAQAALQRPRADLAAARRRAPAAQLPRRTNGRARMRAAADVPGLPLGREVTTLDIARAAATRFASMPAGVPGRHEFALASIERPYGELMAEGNDDTEVMNRARDEHRLPGGSLLAAGGWCAPSETIYDIVTHSTVTGIWSTPEVGVRRGGLRWAAGPDFSAIYAGTGFIQTEAQNIAGMVKPCYEVPCPGFQEIRLDAVGLCIKAGILQTRGYPEQVDAVIGEALNAHAHRVNATKIARAAALAKPVAASARRLGPFLDALDWIELQIEDQRYKYRLNPQDTVEAVIPLWFRPILRTDLQRRLNLNEPSVADAALNARFRDRYVAVQWVYDWQDALTNPAAAPDAGLFGGADPITDYPASVDVLIYPSGAYLVSNDPIITLQGIYDSVNTATNTYTALFTEESLAVALRDMEARRLTIPIDRRLPAA